MSAALKREDIIRTFDGFRREIDANNDRRERLIKLSRDVTNLSKKVIFLLHRIATEETEGTVASAVQQSREKSAEILLIFDQMRVELEGENFWRYQRIISGGVQEFIESLSFAYYLEHGTLLTFQKIQEEFTSRAEAPIFPLGLPYTDYLLGVSDLTGELMRFAITSIGRRGVMSKTDIDKATAVCNFVRACRSDWEVLTPYIRELGAKQDVTTNSLKKIELAAYNVAIRGFERARLNDFRSPHTCHPDNDGTNTREEID